MCGGNPYFTNQFCRVVLDPNHEFKKSDKPFEYVASKFFL